MAVVFVVFAVEFPLDFQSRFSISSSANDVDVYKKTAHSWRDDRKAVILEKLLHWEGSSTYATSGINSRRLTTVCTKSADLFQLQGGGRPQDEVHVNSASLV